MIWYKDNPNFVRLRNVRYKDSGLPVSGATGVVTLYNRVTPETVYAGAAPVNFVETRTGRYVAVFSPAIGLTSGLSLRAWYGLSVAGAVVAAGYVDIDVKEKSAR